VYVTTKFRGVAGFTVADETKLEVYVTTKFRGVAGVSALEIRPLGIFLSTGRVSVVLAG